MDELLVSGETMVRNMQRGLDRAAAFGGAMDVGYLPDMFGHVAQMPQLLAQLGFEHTVVWRGVPEAIDAEAFTWVAPDGSTVRAEYLSDGYSNGAILPLDAKELLERIDEFCRRQGPLVGDPVLWMNGTDHLMPQPWLGRVVAEANEIQDDYHLEVTSLATHVRRGRTEDLPVWKGELRSSARTNLLMGTASNRDGREAGRGPRRAGPGAAGRAARGAVPAGRRLARGLPRSRLARGDPQQRPRLDLRLLARRGRRRRPASLRGGDPHRRGRDRPERSSASSPTRASRSSSPTRPPATRSGVVELVVTGDDPPAGASPCGSARRGNGPTRSPASRPRRS